MSRVKRHFKMEDVPVDRRLSADHGWLKMEVQWLATAEQCGSEHTVVGRTIFRPAEPGKSSMHDLHTHPHAEETILIMSGTGRAISGDEEFAVGPGSVIFIPAGDRHLLENTSATEPMDAIWVYGGAPNLAGAGYKQLEPQGKK